MDFPSREEARAHIRMQAEGGPSAGPSPPAAPAADPPSGAAAPADPAGGNGAAGEGTRFRVEKPGYQTDVFDRRGIRNLIRTGAVLEKDRIRVDESGPVPASDLPYFKSLFNLAKAQKARPPACCRTHTDRVAFFRCQSSGRPLCDDCAPDKKFGGQTIRVCQHCGGNAAELVQA